jgi:hypothetical protein
MIFLVDFDDLKAQELRCDSFPDNDSVLSISLTFSIFILKLLFINNLNNICEAFSVNLVGKLYGMVVETPCLWNQHLSRKMLNLKCLLSYYKSILAVGMELANRRQAAWCGLN